jgi:hypothetical protein
MTSAILFGSSRLKRDTQFINANISGGILGHVSATGGSYSSNSNDYAILFTGTSGTLVLPSATSVPGQSIKILSQGSITATGPSMINGTGAMPNALLAGRGCIQLTADGISNSWWSC